MLQGNIFRRLDAFEIGEKIRRSWVFLCETSPVVRTVYTHMFFSQFCVLLFGILSVFFEPSSRHFPIRKIQTKRNTNKLSQSISKLRKPYEFRFKVKSENGTITRHVDHTSYNNMHGTRLLIFVFCKELKVCIFRLWFQKCKRFRG